MIRLLSESEILLKAAINRIAARISEKLIHSAQELSEIAEELPQKLQNEWSIFRDEVIEESERISKKTRSPKDPPQKKGVNKENIIQIQIANLRSKVIEINKEIEGRN